MLGCGALCLIHVCPLTKQDHSVRRILTRQPWKTKSQTCKNWEGPVLSKVRLRPLTRGSRGEQYCWELRGSLDEELLFVGWMSFFGLLPPGSSGRLWVPEGRVTKRLVGRICHYAVKVEEGMKDTVLSLHSCLDCRHCGAPNGPWVHPRMRKLSSGGPPLRLQKL